MNPIVHPVTEAVTVAVRLPGYVVERWFGLYLFGWGLVCLFEPAMFDTMPRAFDDLRGADGQFREAHYAALFCALGAFQFFAARRRDRGRLGRRIVAGTVAAAALAGLSAAFVIDGTVTSGTYTYGFLALSEAAVVARLILIRWGRRHGVGVRSEFFAVATPIRS